jgi:hypothetical protein
VGAPRASEPQLAGTGVVANLVDQKTMHNALCLPDALCRKQQNKVQKVVYALYVVGAWYTWSYMRIAGLASSATALSAIGRG